MDLSAGIRLFLSFYGAGDCGFLQRVNLTDGLDGLAIGLMIIAAGAMTILSYVSGHASFANISILLDSPARRS